MLEFSAETAAQKLRDAAQTGKPTERLTSVFGEFDLDQAYRIQELQVQQAQSQGRAVRGYKVGLTSLAMQRQLGVDQPDFGHLFDDMILSSAQPISFDRFISPKVEPEFAFILGKDLTGPKLNIADVAGAVESVCGALEVIDSRIENWDITLSDTIADNASCGAAILGDIFLPLSAVDLRTEGVNLSYQGEIVESGAGAAILGSPLAALAWLANTLGEHGVTLEAGSVILPGSMTRAVPVAAGSTVTASYANFGVVTANFTE